MAKRTLKKPAAALSFDLNTLQRPGILSPI